MCDRKQAAPKYERSFTNLLILFPLQLEEMEAAAKAATRAMDLKSAQFEEQARQFEAAQEQFEIAEKRARRREERLTSQEGRLAEVERKLEEEKEALEEEVHSRREVRGLGLKVAVCELSFFLLCLPFRVGMSGGGN